MRVCAVARQRMLLACHAHGHFAERSKTRRSSMVVIGVLACAALTALLVPSARLSHDQMLSSNTRSSSHAEIKFLRQFLQDAAHQQERKRLALELELTKLKRTCGDGIDQFDEKERAKHLRRAQAVPQLLSEALLAEEQIHGLSGNLSRGCDTAVVRQYIATELGLAERLAVFVPPSEWGRPSGCLLYTSPSPRD